MGIIKDITGQKFSKLTAIEMCGKDKNGLALWKCECDCGNESVVNYYSLLNGHTKSCGCNNKKHGKSDTRIYQTWTNMRGRCYSPKHHGFKYYGGRGIKVCDEWNDSFETFYEWAINNGYEKNLTIERINVNGDYCPNNCTWISKSEQQRNRRDTIYLTYNGKTLNTWQWSKITGLSQETISQRRYSHWNDERILTEPCIKCEAKNIKEKNTPILENLLQTNATCGIIEVVKEKGRKQTVFWKKVFGKMMLDRIQKYIEPRKMSISGLVRIAVERYLDEVEK